MHLMSGSPSGCVLDAIPSNRIYVANSFGAVLGLVERDLHLSQSPPSGPIVASNDMKKKLAQIQLKTTVEHKKVPNFAKNWSEQKKRGMEARKEVNIPLNTDTPIVKKACPTFSSRVLPLEWV